MPDAGLYGDKGSNTLRHIQEARKFLIIPNLVSLGLGIIEPSIMGLGERKRVQGAWGKMASLSPGKDTISGHWELAGVVLEKPFPLYPNGFPREVIASFEKAIGRRVLGNVAASGTEIIELLGEEHLKTGFPIVYTSADSVFQVAAHEEVVPLETLYEWCRIARDRILVGEHAVGRVIARPFQGNPGNFWRTGGRRDFSLEPPEPTLLDLVQERGWETWVAGKVRDIFAGRGITKHFPAGDNRDIMLVWKDVIEQDFCGIFWSTLVDFDMLYGHRNDIEGFASALEEFDLFLGKFLPLFEDGDLLVITADHGCDPLFPGTDHTREYVPLLLYGRQVAARDLGIRKSLADLGATLADVLKCKAPGRGESFAGELFKKEI